MPSRGNNAELLPNQSSDQYFNAVDYVLRPRLALEPQLIALLQTAPDPALWIRVTWERRHRIALTCMARDVASMSARTRSQLTWESVAQNFSGNRSAGWFIRDPTSLWRHLDNWPEDVMEQLLRPNARFPRVSWSRIPIGDKEHKRHQ